MPPHHDTSKASLHYILCEILVFENRTDRSHGRRCAGQSAGAHTHWSIKATTFITARCYAERGAVMASRPSVHPSVT